MKRINTILIDLDRDFWLYVSMEYFKQKIKAGHKIIAERLPIVTGVGHMMGIVIPRRSAELGCNGQFGSGFRCHEAHQYDFDRPGP